MGGVRMRSWVVWGCSDNGDGDERDGWPAGGGMGVMKAGGDSVSVDTMSVRTEGWVRSCGMLCAGGYVCTVCVYRVCARARGREILCLEKAAEKPSADDFRLLSTQLLLLLLLPPPLVEPPRADART